jgi:hypothetical protein
VIKVSSYIAILLAGLSLFVLPALAQEPAQNAPTAAKAARASGDVTQVQPNRLTVHTANGDVQVELPQAVKLLRVPPGAKDLKAAEPITVDEINAGDRAVVLGRPGADPQTIQAVRVVVMSKSDITSYHEAEVRDWQTRGIEGNVKLVDAVKGEVTISAPNHPPTPGNLTHPVVLTTTPQTVLLRYAPNSVKFADAKPSNVAALKVGDQVRALGTVSEDGTHYAADKVVFGTFHNIGATVISIDLTAGTLTVKSLGTGKPMTVHADAECKIHQLPAFLAQTIAGLSSGGVAAGGHPQGGSGAPAGGGPKAGGGGAPHGGMGNFSQMLENMPDLKLSDIKRGQAIVIFSPEGTNPADVTAIFILTGVEPILAAQPKGGEMNLGNWNLSLGGGAAAGDVGP